MKFALEQNESNSEATTLFGECKANKRKVEKNDASNGLGKTRNYPNLKQTTKWNFRKLGKFWANTSVWFYSIYR